MRQLVRRWLHRRGHHQLCEMVPVFSHFLHEGEPWLEQVPIYKLQHQ